MIYEIWQCALTNTRMKWAIRILNRHSNVQTIVKLGKSLLKFKRNRIVFTLKTGKLAY